MLPDDDRKVFDVRSKADRYLSRYGAQVTLYDKVVTLRTGKPAIRCEEKFPVTHSHGVLCGWLTRRATEIPKERVDDLDNQPDSAGDTIALPNVVLEPLL